MLTTVNCCELRTDGAPPTTDWQAVLDAVSDATVEAGLGPMLIEFGSDSAPAGSEGDKEYFRKYCNGSTGECWKWSATVNDGVQWIFFTVQDANLDPTGEGLREAQASKQPPAYIAVEYGATVVRAGMTEEYERAIQPFVGLTQPPPTTSD